MEAIIMREAVYIIRVIIAGFCGACIGFERESKQKSAGFRTHILVAMASAVMVIISKHGFNDVLGQYVHLDPSRVAAGVVTAIGFIGSGVILMKEKFVTGLTTSAGIWATVGVGMAIGAGMYGLGCITSLLIIIVEIFVGKVNTIIPRIRGRAILTIETRDKINTEEIVKELEKYDCIVDSINYKKQADHSFKIKFFLNIHNLKGSISQLVDEINLNHDFSNVYVKE